LSIQGIRTAILEAWNQLYADVLPARLIGRACGMVALAKTASLFVPQPDILFGSHGLLRPRKSVA
jgi:hypothetical protein